MKNEQLLNLMRELISRGRLRIQLSDVGEGIVLHDLFRHSGIAFTNLGK